MMRARSRSWRRCSRALTATRSSPRRSLRPESVDDPFYGDWIRGYASDGYAAGNVILIETLDRLSAHYTEEQLRHLEDIFIACSRYEMVFWQMAWEMRQ